MKTNNDSKDKTQIKTSVKFSQDTHINVGNRHINKAKLAKSQTGINENDIKPIKVNLNNNNFKSKSMYKKISFDDVPEIEDEIEMLNLNVNEIKINSTSKLQEKCDSKPISIKDQILQEKRRKLSDVEIPKLNSRKTFTKNDFEILSISGKGAYGTVLKVNLKGDNSKKLYAIKVIDIYTMIKYNKLYQVYLENEILSLLDSPYIVNVVGGFQSESKIYIVMEYVNNGDFSDLLRLNYPLNEETIEFYAAELVQAISYLQSKNIVHRDLKPENIMVDDKFHLKMIDFATARILGKYFDKNNMTFVDEDNSNKDDPKELMKLKGIREDSSEINDDKDIHNEIGNLIRDKRGRTFVGTAEYVSPEVLKEEPAGFGVDLWALGIIIYQMLVGKTPFKDKTNYLIFKNIENLKIDFPEKLHISEEAKDLVRKLLVKDPEKRLGAGQPGSKNDMEHLKNHPFFGGLDFNQLQNMKVPFHEGFDLLKNYKKNGRFTTMPTKAFESHNPNFTVGNTRNQQILTEGNTLSRIKTEENVIVIKTGFLDKKSPWIHYNKRFIVLDSTPRIAYSDPETNIVKGEIYLNKNCRVNHLDTNSFELITPKKSFKFKAIDNDSMIWEKAIGDTIKKYSYQ